METNRTRKQGIFWLGTIPYSSWEPCQPDGVRWIRGQHERGANTGYEHWQVLVAFSEKKTLAQCKRHFGDAGHWELSRSEAASEYVWKEDTRIGEQFEFGTKPFKRNSPQEWDNFWESAVSGDILDIPADIRIRHYTTFRRIREDYSKPIGMERTCEVFVGPTGTGKSREAWRAAGLEAFPKDPNSKFWCGYTGEKHVVIDEFRGRVDISHLLRWLDRYPVNVDLKGSSIPLRATKIWITSNLHPDEWYPELDPETVLALKRRLKITTFSNFFQ